MSYTKINTRSPYILNATGTNGQTTKAELYIWNAGSSKPTNPTRILSKPIPSTNLTTVHYDISPYIREYINPSVLHSSTGLNVTSSELFAYCEVDMFVNGVNTNSYEFIGYNGYGYFSEGSNPVGNLNVMLNEGDYYVQEGINNGVLFYHNDSIDTWTAKYTCLDGVTADVNISLTHENGNIPYVTPTHLSNGGSKLEISKNGSIEKTFNFIEVCEPKYTPVICDFINKDGVWTTLTFFKLSKESMTMTNKEFNSMPDSINYSLNHNIKSSFNTNAVDSIKVNTGWVKESHSEIIKQLTLSETIRIDNKPSLIKTKNVSFLTGLNDKNMNYTIDFEFANPTINTIQ